MDSDGDSHHLSELRIVLMGYRRAGKSSSGNIILNREEFDLKRTAQCVKRQREVADRHITVIEAPGWWMSTPIDQSPELLKQEILLSVSLCPPGPHVVLLVIRVDSRFTETAERKVMQSYVDLLGERVWSHTIVLFTHGDFLGDTSIEQHIESEGEDLQWLVEKCGNRYHVLNNNNSSDDTQIKHLLEKIEETVMENNGCCFEIDRKILQRMKERRRAEEERAEERMKRMKKQRELIRSQMSDTQKLSELRIVLMGYRYSGKSSSGNIILNREEFDLKRTAQCVKRQREVADRHITVIEAPGWWSTIPVEESPELLKQEILLSVSLCPPGPHVVLLVIRVDIIFKEDKRKVLKGYVDLLGERVWSHTIVLFTHGDFLGDTSIEQHIESEGEDLQWLVEKCGNRYHVLNNNNSSDDTQIKHLLEKIEETVMENNGCCFGMDGNILQEERRGVEEERGRSQGISRNETSDTVSLGSSGYDSFRSRPGADYSSDFASSRSKDRPIRFGSGSSYKTVLRQAFRSGDKFDKVSRGSSGYGSFRSRSGADNTSIFASSQSKDRSVSFGDESVRFTVEDLGMKKTKSLPVISKLRSKHKNKQMIKKQTL